MNIACWLQRKCNEHKISQTKFCERSGISRTAAWPTYSGGQSLRTLRTMARFFNIQLSQLIAEAELIPEDTKKQKQRPYAPNPNPSKPKGYYLHKGSGKYMAMCWSGEVRHYLGLFKTEEEARAAYLKFKENTCAE